MIEPTTVEPSSGFAMFVLEQIEARPRITDTSTKTETIVAGRSEGGSGEPEVHEGQQCQSIRQLISFR